MQELISAALAAGEAILKVYARADMGSRDKPDGSPVTEADTQAEAIILAALARTYPDMPVVAEERMAGGKAPQVKGEFFLVDPLDGTREFVSRNGDFTVNIGKIVDGAPVWGVVYAPAYGDIFVGQVGKGARQAKVVDGAVGAWSELKVRPRPGALDIVASRSHLSLETSAFIAKFPGARLVQAGSSLKFCRLAAGEADLYPRLSRTMEWDTAAGDAILRAAGGRVCTLDGAPLTYGKRNSAHEEDFANPWFVASGPFDPWETA